MLSYPHDPHPIWIYIGIAAGLAVALVTVASVSATSPWIQLASMPYTPAYHAFLAVDPHLYVIGGDIGSGPLNKVMVGNVVGDGTVKTWSTSSIELPQPLSEHIAVLADRWVYLIGGTNGKNTLRTVYRGDMPADGKIGPWTSEASLLPDSLRGHAGVVLDRAIFVIGGRDEGGKAKAKVYRSIVEDSGQLQAWQEAGKLPQPLSHSAPAIYRNQVYLLGGENEKGPVDTIYSAVLTSTGEVVWKAQRSLPHPSSRGTAFVHGTVLFYIGGYDGTAAQIETYAAPIRWDGSLGEWLGWLPLPKGTMGLRVALLNNRAYLTGGFDGARFLSTLHFVAVDKPLPPTPTSTPVPKPLPDVLPVAKTVSVTVVGIAFLVIVGGLVAERLGLPRRPKAE